MADLTELKLRFITICPHFRWYLSNPAAAAVAASSSKTHPQKRQLMWLLLSMLPLMMLLFLLLLLLCAKDHLHFYCPQIERLLKCINNTAK